MLATPHRLIRPKIRLSPILPDEDAGSVYGKHITQGTEKADHHYRSYRDFFCALIEIR